MWLFIIYSDFLYKRITHKKEIKEKMEVHNDLLPDVNSFPPQGIYANGRYSTEQWIKDLNIKNKIRQEIYLKS